MTTVLEHLPPSALPVHAHPAKYSTPIMAEIVHALGKHLPNRFDYIESAIILDPFAGTGRIHALRGIDRRYYTIGIEIESEWADMHPHTIQGDATKLPWQRQMFDAIVTSPCYGNRMADRYAGDAKGSTRHTYRIALGHDLAEGSAAGLQWGAAYRELHERAWAEAFRVLKPNGLFVLNISDHIRNGEVVEVSAWHVGALEALGLTLVESTPISTRRQRHGRNGDARVDNEWLHVFKKEVSK